MNWVQFSIYTCSYQNSYLSTFDLNIWVENTISSNLSSPCQGFQIIDGTFQFYNTYFWKKKVTKKNCRLLELLLKLWYFFYLETSRLIDNNGFLKSFDVMLVFFPYFWSHCLFFVSILETRKYFSLTSRTRKSFSLKRN